MQDFFVALGLVLVIEGVLWALFPNYLTQMLEAAREMPPETLRFFALGTAAFGVAIVWLARGG